MAMGPVSKAALIVSIPGILAFILGILAENKKPEDGAIAMETVNGYTICHYPNDSSVGFGVASVVLLFVTTCIALGALFFPFQGKQLPYKAFVKSTTLLVFFILSLAVYVTAEVLLLWATIAEAVHHKQNKHYHLNGACPSAKAGLFGGAAFLALDSTLFWLICLMLLVNAREDHFDVDDTQKGVYSEIPYDSTIVPPANKV